MKNYAKKVKAEYDTNTRENARKGLNKIGDPKVLTKAIEKKMGGKPPTFAQLRKQNPRLKPDGKGNLSY